MAKKKKEVCPYCGNSFAYLSRQSVKLKRELRARKKVRNQTLKEDRKELKSESEKAYGV